jgi:serine/threonine protein kinase/WD40 repeat protein
MDDSSKDAQDKTVTAPTRQASVTAPTMYPSTSEHDVPAEWRIGETILDTYEVVEVLGKGGMGIVYRVHHKGWNLDLAVKCPRREIFAKAGGKKAFKREAENWVKLGLHPHIVSCYYIRTLGAIPYVFAEYVSGQSLGEAIRSRKIYEGGSAQSLARILDYAIQFAWALHYSHEQRLIHQDVKPANVLIALEGMLKVTDFGLSKARSLAGESKDSQGSVFVSYGGMTPAYCSPEQAQKVELTRKTDIWSWAISVWEMFSGAPPCRYGQTAAELFQQFSGDEFGNPGILMPPALRSLLQQCFQKNPVDRPADMQKIADVLVQIYNAAIGVPYQRRQPKAADLLSDSLNNYAVSMLDLGLTAEASDKLNHALKADPRHPEANFNSLLLSWRSSEITDFEVTERLGSISAVPSAEKRIVQLLKNVEEERGDWKAIELLPGRTIVAIDPSGSQAVVREADQFSILSIPHGKLLWRFEQINEYFSFACFAPAANLLLLCDWERFVVWNMDDRTKLRDVLLPLDYRRKLLEAPVVGNDGSVFYPVDGKITVCPPDTTEFLCLCSVEHATVRSLCLDSQGNRILAAYNDRAVRCWNVKNGRLEFTFQIGNSAGMSATFSADGMRFAACLGNGAIHVYEAIDGGQLLSKFEPSPDFARIAAFDPGGAKLATWNDCFSEGKPGIDTGMIRIWELASGRCIKTFPNVKRDFAANLVFGNRHLFAFNHDGGKAWLVPEQHKRASFQIVRPTSAVAALSAATEFENVAEKVRDLIHDRRDEEASAVLRAHLVVHPEFRFEPRTLEFFRVLHSRNRKTRIRDYWLLQEMKIDRSLPVTAVSFLQPTIAISGSKAGTLQIWDLQTGQCQGQLRGHRDGIQNIVVSDARIVTIDNRNRLRAWNTSSLNCIAYFDYSSYKPILLRPALSSDGQYVATTDEENSLLYVWDLDLEELDSSRPLPAGTAPATHLTAVVRKQNSCEVTPDDNVVIVRNPATGELLSELKGHSANVVSCDISADDRLVISGDEAGYLRFWEIDWELGFDYV